MFDLHPILRISLKDNVIVSKKSRHYLQVDIVNLKSVSKYLFFKGSMHIKCAFVETKLVLLLCLSARIDHSALECNGFGFLLFH